MSEEKREFVFKITVLGDAAVGKTSLINQYIEQSFQEDYKPTLGANIIRKDVSVDEINANVRLIMWDLAGQEKYNVIRSMYFQGCVGALLVYDVTRHSTFDAINSKWLKDFKKYVKKEGTYILIGNKIDLSDQRVVDTEEGKNFANKIDASDFIETSAKTGDNVEVAFQNLVHKILVKLGEIK
ncbi:MAG: GTP-binding protein [Candidatus Lokiarchaeota archaeon]|nr:GTP-binding protein [Candidatus Lokiarchaeota archaeon]MBD3338259.1 GTP-binding protein [Candidatus Lokiarchaeota archaeon]